MASGADQLVTTKTGAATPYVCSIYDHQTELIYLTSCSACTGSKAVCSVHTWEHVHCRSWHPIITLACTDLPAFML